MSALRQLANEKNNRPRRQCRHMELTSQSRTWCSLAWRCTARAPDVEVFTITSQSILALGKTRQNVGVIGEQLHDKSRSCFDPVHLTHRSSRTRKINSHDGVNYLLEELRGPLQQKPMHQKRKLLSDFKHLSHMQKPQRSAVYQQKQSS